MPPPALFDSPECTILFTLICQFLVLTPDILCNSCIFRAVSHLLISCSYISSVQFFGPGGNWAQGSCTGGEQHTTRPNVWTRGPWAITSFHHYKWINGPALMHCPTIFRTSLSCTIHTFLAHLCFCTVGSYATLSVCPSVCNLTKIQTRKKIHISESIYKS